VSFKKATEGVGRGRVANARWEWVPHSGGYNTKPREANVVRTRGTDNRLVFAEHRERVGVCQFRREWRLAGWMEQRMLWVACINFIVCYWLLIIIVQSYHGSETWTLLMFCNGSVMENLPPVILTDEDICLEIVEKGKFLLTCWSKLMQGLSSFITQMCQKCCSLH